MLRRGGRGAAVALIAVVWTTGVPLVVGTTVIPLTTRVIALSLESAPVSLENLFGRGRAGFSGGALGLGGWWRLL